jgi:uncharacterized protein
MNLITNLPARVAFILGIFCFVSTAEAQQVENAIFWEVSGNGLSKPSYLFGTFHLKGKSYIDSLKNVTAKLNQADAVVGEVVFDSTIAIKTMAAARMYSMTLDKLLSPEAYSQTATFFKELSGMELRFYNSFKPMMIQNIMMLMAFQKRFSYDAATDTPMDLYFQGHGKSSNKAVYGLETIDVQIHALFEQHTLERQAEILSKFVADKEKMYKGMIDMVNSYKQGNLGELEKLATDESFSEEEIKVMLDNRNIHWIEQLPALFRTQSCFVAVGALHLPGTNGLVNLLRKQGFTVRPVPTI